MSISVVLLSGCAALPVKSAVKDDQPHVDRWNDLPVPGSYDPDAFTIAEGSDILFLETGSNGQSVYAVVSGGQNHLYATDDNGAGWEKLSSMAPGITSLIASPSCDQTLYYSTDTRVYRSTDGGQSFRALAVLRDVETGGGEITGIDVTRWQGAKVLAAGVKAPGRETRGGVYLLLPDEMLASWRDTGLSGLDVFAVSFLPEENGELSIAAVGNDGMHSWVTAMSGQSGWDSLWQKIELAHRSGEAVSSLESAVISLHPGYQPDTYHGFLVGLDTGMGRGDIYRVHLGQEPFSSQAYSVYHRIDSHLDNVDISVIYQNADGLIYTGLANSPGVLTSTDSASTWQQTESLFTGNRVSGLAVSGSGHFVATSGPESAVSFSARGSGWQQTAFIDTRIDVVVDFALSCPEGSRKGIYLLTWGGEASLWYFKDS